MKNKKKYNYNNIDIGFYDNIFHKNKGVHSAWHYTKFYNMKKNCIN